MNRKALYFEIGLFAVAVAAHVVISLGTEAGLARWYRSDDAFYYFKTARNIAMGLGSTFDGVSPSNGYHPLWMLICVPVFTLARIDPWLPLRILIVISGTLTAAGGVLLFRMLLRAGVGEAGALAAIFWVMWPDVHATTTQLGMENALVGFMFVLVLYLLSRLPMDRPLPQNLLWGIAISLALLVLARLDNVFVAFLFGLWVVLANSPFRTRVVLFALIVPLSLAAGLLLRVGPVSYPSFKTGTSIMLAAAWLIQVPVFLAAIQFRTPRFRVRAVSIVGATLAATALLEGVALLVRFTGLASYPLLVPLYSGVIAAVLLIGVEGYLWWLHPGAPGVSAREELAVKWRAWVRRALVVYGVLGFTLAAYMAWSQAVFHSPIPVSGQIKEWWGTIYSPYGRPPGSVAGVLGIDPGLAGSPVEPIARALALYADPLPTGSFYILSIGVIALVLWLLRGAWLREQAARLGVIPLGCGMAILAWTYGLRGYVNMREWYWIGVIVFGVCWVGLLMGLFWRWSSQRVRAPVLAGTLVAVSLALVLNFADYASSRFVHPDASPWVTFEEVLRFLSEESEPGSLIGVTGGGTVAYFLEGRSIVNLDGLANSVEYFRLLRLHRGASFLRSIGLDYVFAPRGRMPAAEPYLEMFSESLIPVATQGPMVLFRFQPPGE
jgi:hypothetical protein